VAVPRLFGACARGVDMGHEFVARELFDIARHVGSAESAYFAAFDVSVLMLKMQERPEFETGVRYRDRQVII
jgi:hypothetical protein